MFGGLCFIMADDNNTTRLLFNIMSATWHDHLAIVKVARTPVQRLLFIEWLRARAYATVA